MDVLSTVEEVRQRLRPLAREGLRIGLVPTMGALHRGHLSLIEACKQHAEVTVCSLFVNPKQFGPAEDLDRYPRDLESDRRALEETGCDVVFAPSVEEIYPAGFQTRVEVSEVTQGLCGAFRPEHFGGVTTVVMKLFAIVDPDIAVFGQKDYQQLIVIRRMAADLALRVEIVGAPIVREPDGLAMSSRNVFLSRAERTHATALFRGLSAAKQAFDHGEHSVDRLLAHARAPLQEAELEPEYLELRSADTLSVLQEVKQRAVILVAARVGHTRLIDNILLSGSNS